MSLGNRRSQNETSVSYFKEGTKSRFLAGLSSLLSFIASFTLPLYAAGTNGAESLLAGIGARPSALGGAYTALANDPLALAYNPSGLARIKRPMLSLMHSEWLEGSQMQFAALALPSKAGVLGLSFYRMDMGQFTGRDSAGRLSDDFSAGDLAVSLGMARQIHPRILAGFKLSYFQESLAGYKAATYFGDFGIMLAANKKLTFGAAIQNAGPGLRFINEVSKLPLTYALGAGFNLGGIRLAADYKMRPGEKSHELAAGVELAPAAGESSGRPLALRLGYHGLESAGASALGGLGAGFGLALGAIGLDYSFQPFGLLGNAHRMNLTIKF
ncbi:MAG: PorV/PorQ family protein [Elusimicrobiota bacterium]